MSQDIFAIIVVLIVIVLYASEAIPLVVTTLLAMFVMYYSGILTFAQAFSGFNATATMMVLGMAFIGIGFFQCGLVDKTSELITKVAGTNEKRFMTLACAFCIVAGIVINSIVLLSMFMFIVDGYERTTNGAISRKRCYLPIAIFSIYGGLLGSFTVSSYINASGILEASGYGRGFSVFQSTPIAGPAVLVTLILYVLVGYRASCKWFNFESPPLDIAQTRTKTEFNKSKSIRFGIIFLICMYGFVFTDYNMGAVALGSAVLLMLFGCIEPKSAIKSVNWETIVIIAGSIGFAKGVDVSGAGQTIAAFLINLLGPLGESPFGMCAFMLLLTTFISEFMVNNSAVVICCPIALAVAAQLGTDPLPYALGVGIGANLSVACPLATAGITSTLTAGYRFKDFVRLGGMLNLSAAVLCCVMLYIVHF